MAGSTTVSAPAALIAKLGKIAGMTMVYLVLFDIGGVVASLFYALTGLSSVGLFYLLWFVAGVFCGLMSYASAGEFASPESKGDWTRCRDAIETGRLICATSVLILIGLYFLFARLLWSTAHAGDNYVPDSMPLTVTFFSGVVAGAFFAHYVAPSWKPSTSKANQPG